MEDKRVKQFFSESGYQWKEGGHKEKMNEDEYGECIVYSYMKIEE
jgi:hypothetical protein